MTLKIPQRVGNMEHNLALTSQQAAAILKADGLLGHGALLQSMLDLLDQYTINLDAIHTLASLTTTRREYQTPIGLMALDRNEYTNKVDYELELEVEDAGLGEQNFNTFLKENKIEYRYARSKVVRFLESIGKMS